MFFSSKKSSVAEPKIFSFGSGSGSGSDSGSKGPQKRFAIPAPAPAPNKILEDTLTTTFFDLSNRTFLHGFMHDVPK